MDWLKLSRTERNKRMTAAKTSPGYYPKSGTHGDRWLSSLILTDSNPWHGHDQRYLETAENFCRSVRLARDITRSIKHRGWYVDSSQDETTEGVVLVLPHGRFAIGCTDPWNDGPALISRDVYTDENEAAHAADSFAERYAEELKEQDEKDREEQKQEDDKRESAERAHWESRDVETVG